MAEQGKIVMLAVGATGRKEQLSSNKSYNESYRESNGGNTVPDRMTGQPNGAGFTSNQRPAEPSSDLIDNPQFGFQLHSHSESLPNLTNNPTDNGFHQLRSLSKAPPVEKKTEYQRVFVSHPLTATVLPNQVVGPKSNTGFTEGTDLQLYTFTEKNSSTVEPRQIHRSVMRIDFVPPPLQQGTEAIPSQRSRPSQESGYTRGAKAALNWPSSLLPSPQPKSDTPVVKTIGRKEPTGFLRNVPSNQIFPKTPFESSHFITHYQTTFRQCGNMRNLTCAHPGRIIDVKNSSSYHRHHKDRFEI